MTTLGRLIGKDLKVLRHARADWARESRFKIAVVGAFGVGLLAGLWGLFYYGFHFLATLGGLGLALVYRLLFLFFWSVSVMIVISSLASSYATFFRSDETEFLLLQPMESGSVALYKSLQAAFFASWAFLFMIVPYMGAFITHEKLPLSFFVALAFFGLPFVLFCSGIGSLLLLAGLAIWRRLSLWCRRSLVLMIAGIVGWALVTQPVRVPSDLTLAVQKLIPVLGWVTHPLWPGWWVAEGALSVARGEWARGAKLWWVVLANALFVLWLVHRVGGRLLLWNVTQEGAARKAARAPAPWRRFLERILGFLPQDLRAIIVKDWVVFARDPAQWAQFAFFFGLLALYFLNLRTLRYHLLPPTWRAVIAGLNVISVCSIMASLGSRFVYPQLSLEGHSLWILGLSPLTARRIVTAKFVGALALIGGAGIPLMAISTAMLKPAAGMSALAVLIGISTATTVAGLSTGLGGVFLDPKQKNPAAIVSGFGGTLNLVLNLLFIVLAVLPVVLFSYMRLRMDRPLGAGALLGSAVWLLIMTALFSAPPLRLAVRHLERRP